MHYSITEQLKINILKFECLSKLIRGEKHQRNNPVLKRLRFHSVTQDKFVKKSLRGRMGWGGNFGGRETNICSWKFCGIYLRSRFLFRHKRQANRYKN